MKRTQMTGEYDLHPMKREEEMTEEEKKEQDAGFREACRHFYEQFGRIPPVPAGNRL